MSAAEMAEAMYPESDITYGYQAVREAYQYGYAAAENRVLDADQRIVGYGREQTPVPGAVCDEFRAFIRSRISELDADISGIEQALSNLGDGGELR